MKCRRRPLLVTPELVTPDFLAPGHRAADPHLLITPIRPAVIAVAARRARPVRFAPKWLARASRRRKMTKNVGAPESKIKITPEMIEAGVKVVWGFEVFFSLSPSSERILVRRILEAAFEASSEDFSESSQARSGVL
jgi:hypothetical protein